jgi:hypothetical protein
MFAFIAISLAVSLALAYFATRNLGDNSAPTAASLTLGLALPLVAIAILGKSLSIHDLSIASMMLSAIAITMAAVSFKSRLQPVRVVASSRSRRRPF